jgi:hypothetical protein
MFGPCSGRPDQQEAKKMGDNPGVLIAIDLTFLYLIMGPLVLVGIYVLFDYFIGVDYEARAEKKEAKNRMDKDPAFWTRKDVWRNF